MKELAEILAAFDVLCAAGKPAALATVVAVEGSAYRRPGARMLVAADGRTWGGVSGGCLERDVARRARGVIDTGRPTRFCYDTADEESIAPGAATGCGGSVDVFIQPISSACPGPLPLIARAIRERRPVTFSTLLRPADGEAVDHVGACVALGDETKHAAADAMNVPRLPPNLARPRIIRTAAGEFFIDRLLPPQALVIFGAGPDAIPLLAIGRTLGWHVTVVASRPAPGLSERLATADALHISTSDDPIGGVLIPPDAAVVVMTHNVARDADILAALRGPFRYLGLLGPRHRTRKLLAGLPDGRVRGVEPERFFAPVGLDIGAETPEEIALAIAGEIQATLRRASGRSLRDRRGAVHDPQSTEPLLKSAHRPGATAHDAAADRDRPWRSACAV